MVEEEKDVTDNTEEAVEEIQPVEDDYAGDSLDDLKAFFGDEEETEEEEEEEAEDSEGEVEEEPEDSESEEIAEEITGELIEEPVAETPTIDPTEEKKFSQKDLDRIIGQSRIQGREQADTVRLLEQETGMPIEQIWDFVKNQRVEKYENDYGMPTDEAQRLVEATQKVPYLEGQLQELHQKQQQMQYQQQLMANYESEKAQYISKPEVKRYEAEINAIIRDSWQQGRPIGWTAAMSVVLGQKVLSGELSQNIKTSTQQKTLQNISKRPKVSPEGSGGGGPQSRSIPPGLKRLAEQLGVNPADAAKNYWDLQKRK